MVREGQSVVTVEQQVTASCNGCPTGHSLLCSHEAKA
jgi:hypothetical protein